MDEPGFSSAASALLAAGAKRVPVPVDQDGLNVAAGLAPDARIAYCRSSL